MPTYDYVCESCQHSFEQFQSITARPLRKCPECRKLKLKRLIGTGAGVLFRGSGFYETDYRSESYKKAQKAETDSAKPKSDKTNAKNGDAPKKPDQGGSSATKSADKQTKTT